MTHRIGLVIVALSTATAVAAADLLPLKTGIYVPAASACRNASRVDMVNYWGGRSAIGNGMAECEIVKVSHKGNVFTYTDKCTDIQSGEAITGSPNTLVVLGPGSFRLGVGRDAETYKYCGARPQ